MKNRSFLIVLALITAGISAFSQHEPFQSSIDVYKADSVLKVHDTLDHAIVIIDLRTPAEYLGGYLEGAVNYNYYDPGFNDTLAKLDKNGEYLIYCASGGRSGNAFNKMKQMEFQMVYNMIGGASAWRSAGLPLVTGGTGVNFIENNSLYVSVFPNPVTPESKFVLHEGAGKMADVRVLNMQGQMIREFKLEPGGYMPVGNDQLGNGLYFYQVYSEDELIHTGKFLKTR